MAQRPWASAATSYWVSPVGHRRDLGKSAAESIRTWLEHGIWGVPEKAAGRKHFRAGDLICFYVAGEGVVAAAEIAGAADQVLSEAEAPEPLHPDRVPFYRVPLVNVRWLPAPIPLDATLRAQLEAFQGRRESAPWSWFIQSTSRVSEHDFRLLTGAAASTLS